MDFLYCLTLILIDLVLLGRLTESAYKIYKAYSPSFGLKTEDDEISPVEEPVEEMAPRGKYDVDAFRQRIAMLQKDEDGLYDVVPPQMPILYDFTGTEIITENFEKEVDRRFT